ncbi:GGDEF domain-containing protein [Acinetobacter bouvetii]|uniref:GGDEF domain-containing protein n=1 Tax=Acinetobacter bouvetii TaxID=202951 RepID=UPI00157BD202|nr:GGDEF domain-containing protein [Acinetobacter bouvetii]
MLLTSSRSISAQQQLHAFFITASIIFICCLCGILTRPVTYLAYLWPANAVLLGLFLRYNHLKVSGGWLGAFTGYMLADLVTGNHFQLTFILTLSNLINVIVSLFFIRYWKLNYRNYNQGFTFLYLFTICALGGCLASALFAVSTIPYMPNTFMSTQRLGIDFGMWWAGEIVNCITILPLILFLPTTIEEVRKNFKQISLRKLDYTKFLPLLAILISVSFTHVFVGPGALLYPLAALIWAALSYPIFTVAIINSIVCLVTYHSLTDFYLLDSSNAYLTTTISVRIGLCMLGFAPLILCIITSNRRELYKKVLRLANYDSLTNTLNRRHFFEQGEKYLLDQKNNSISLIMFDLDHFKKMNDQYGHHVGDLLLQHFSQFVQDNIRTNELFARVGGEEFLILIMNTTLQESHAIAERIRLKAELTPMRLNQDELLFITTSIGITHHSLPTEVSLQNMINQADQALYQSKTLGRNRISIAS